MDVSNNRPTFAYLTLSYSSKINGYLQCISSKGFSTLEKNALICYQRAMLPIQ
jgi:hypothetical protein